MPVHQASAKSGRGPRQAKIVLALALVYGLAIPAHATISTTGVVITGPTPVTVGPGNTLLPSTGMWVGASAAGDLRVDGGSFLQLARLSLGSGGAGQGTGLISGAGTLVQLVGDGLSNSQVQRLLVGNWGQGTLTVNQGARVDTSTNLAPCLISFHFCDSFVGGAAGDTATLNISGSGSTVRTGMNFFVAHPGLAVPALDGYTYGNPGGTTRGTVNISAGGQLITDRAQIATAHWSTAATGSERNIGEVNLSDVGSRWLVVGGQTVDHVTGNITQGGATVLTANDRNSWASIAVRNGAVIEFQAVPGLVNGFNFTRGGGRTDLLISGPGSAMLMNGGYWQLGRSGGSANGLINDGGSVRDAWYVSVGRDSSFGVLNLDGAGSFLSVSRMGSLGSTEANSQGGMQIGRSSTGIVTVSNGAQIQISATSGRDVARYIELGVGAGSSGTLNITGAGSKTVLNVASQVAGGGPTEILGAYVGVGAQGSGTLNLSAGGQLLLQSTVVSTIADPRSTIVNIGGSNDAAGGARGLMTISGAGSEMRLSGADSFVGVGRGAGSYGELSLSNLGHAVSTIMHIGRAGTGVLKMDNATLELSGQYAGSTQPGASLGIGVLGGTGVAQISNGSAVLIRNMGSNGASLNLGGTPLSPGGDGALTLSGGSSLRLETAPGQAAVSVGRDGSGILRLTGASTLDVGDGRMYVGRLPGSDGTVVASGGSTVHVGWLGVGRNLVAGVDVDGGTGTMVLNGATLNAQTVVIGTNGFLGGTAGSINAATVINYGTFSPGSSPGSFTINADFIARAGSRLVLEVQADGLGGFLTDQVFFKGGQALQLDQMNIEFRFLGLTDPQAFKDSGGFDIQSFLSLADASGTLTPLPTSLFSAVNFTAQAQNYVFNSFSFDSTKGAAAADFALTPVPEPGTWMMLALGLCGLVVRIKSHAGREVAQI